MSKKRKLVKPPIKEAVIELQFQPTLDFDKEDLDKLKTKLSSNYSKADFIETREVSFGLGTNLQSKIVDSPPKLQGIRFNDTTRGFIVLFLRNRLSVSKLSPYKSFEDLFEETLNMLNSISFLIKNQNISRIGVRYINEIKPNNMTKDTVQKIILKKYLHYFDKCKKNPFSKHYWR